MSCCTLAAPADTPARELHQGALEVDAALRLLESRRETRTFRELRQMTEGVHIVTSVKTRLSFLEWACAVFHKDWLDLCLEEAAKASGEAAAAPPQDSPRGEAESRRAQYEAELVHAKAQERAEAERAEAELAQRRAELRRRSERFERGE